MTASKARHRFTVFTACCTFVLIIAGGLVTSTGSGLAVPDWPLSYGMLMPPLVGGIFYEHGHRMIATFVGFLTVILAGWYWKSEERRWVRTLAFVALGSVIVQGLLGGLTVILLLPTAISVSHATLAQTFFCMTALLALVSSSWWNSDVPLLKEQGRSMPLATLSLLMVAVVYVQLILGAVMRHTESGLAVPDFPLIYGQIVPSLSAEALESYNKILLSDNIRIAADGPITSAQILIHVLHRAWAIIVTIVAIILSRRLFLERRKAPRLALFSLALPILILFQILLGMLTVLSRKQVDVTTAHVAAGALILVTSFLSLLHVIKYQGFQLRVSPALTPASEAIAR